MELTDRTIKCVDCGIEFVFTTGQQLFFQENHFRNNPKRSRNCKAIRVGGSTSARVETRAVCAKCRQETTVPFRPTQGRPVVCRTCFQKVKNAPRCS